MAELIFKARINIYFPLNASEIQIKKCEAEARKAVEYFTLPLKVNFKCDLFIYHPDEQSEQCGHKDYGVRIELTREVDDMSSYYNFIKYFDGFAGLLTKKETFYRTEFELL